MIWVLMAWLVALALAVVLVLSAGLGVWRSAKVLTGALGDIGEHAAKAADELSSVTSATGSREPVERVPSHFAPSRREPWARPARTMSARRRPPVVRGR